MWCDWYLHDSNLPKTWPLFLQSDCFIQAVSGSCWCLFVHHFQYSTKVLIQIIWRTCYTYPSNLRLDVPVNEIWKCAFLNCYTIDAPWKWGNEFFTPYCPNLQLINPVILALLHKRRSYNTAQQTLRSIQLSMYQLVHSLLLPLQQQKENQYLVSPSVLLCAFQWDPCA